MKKMKNILLALSLVVIAILPMLTACGPMQEPSLALTTDFKNEYIIGESLEVAGGILTYTDETGKETYIAVEADMITGFSTEVVGERNMVITYSDLTILYPYSVEGPADVKLNVPYYAKTDKGYSVVVFDEANVSIWETTIMPTLNNKEKLLQEGVSGTTLIGSIDYTKAIVDSKYVYTFIDDVFQQSYSVTVVAEGQIEIKATRGEQQLELAMQEAGNEDATLEYGVGYYFDQGEYSAALVIEADGTFAIYPNIGERDWAVENVEDVLATEKEAGRIVEGTYSSSIVNNELVFTCELEISNSGTSTIVLKENGSLYMIGEDSSAEAMIFTKIV